MHECLWCVLVHVSCCEFPGSHSGQLGWVGIEAGGEEVNTFSWHRAAQEEVVLEEGLQVALACPYL